MEPASNAPQNQEAVQAYLESKKTLPPGTKKGQLVINDNKVLVLRELTTLENFGKKIGLGPAAARNVLSFVSNKHIPISDPARLEYKLEKHTIRGFIKSFFYPKPTKAAFDPAPNTEPKPVVVPEKTLDESPAPTPNSSPQAQIPPNPPVAPYKLKPGRLTDAGMVKGYLLTMTITPDGKIECSAKKDTVVVAVPPQISKAVNDFAKMGPKKGEEANFHQLIFSIFGMQMRFYSKSELKIGDELNFSQTQRQQKYFPNVQNAKCTVTNVHYDEEKNDIVYTFKRITGESSNEVWTETQTQLHTPAQPVKSEE